MKTYDSAVIDSTGVFLIGQLEQLDRTIHEPLQDFTYTRDIELRSDATMGHDFTSFTNSAMASVGGLVSGTGKKAFVSKNSTTLPNVALDIGKTASPLLPWGLELDYTIFELESAMLTTGGSIDEQKYDAMKDKYEQDSDIMVYLGDTDIPNAFGLFNSPQVTTGAVAASGTASSTLWSAKTPTQILADVDALCKSVYVSSAYKYCPRKLLVSPLAMASLTQPITTAGSQSVLNYIRENCYSAITNGVPLEIKVQKWLTGTNNGNSLGVNATDMMFAYTQKYNLVRWPRVPMIGLPVQFRGIHQLRPYVSKLGLVEFVYPETMQSAYGIA